MTPLQLLFSPAAIPIPLPLPHFLSLSPSFAAAATPNKNCIPERRVLWQILRFRDVYFSIMKYSQRAQASANCAALK